MKKKSNSLLNMILRSHKNKNPLPDAPHASSTPVDMEIEQIGLEGNPTQSQLHTEGGSNSNRRVQFESSDRLGLPVASSLNPLSSVPQFSWDTYGFPEHPPPQSNVNDCDSTPPTRVVTPDIDSIEKSVTKIDVELSALSYDVSNPLDYFKKVKQLGESLDFYCASVEFISTTKVSEIRNMIANMKHRLQGVKPRRITPSASHSSYRRPSHPEYVTSDMLDTRLTKFHNDMETAFSSQLTRFTEVLDENISLIEARIASNVQSSLAQDIDTMSRDFSERYNQVFDSTEDMSAKIEELEQIVRDTLMENSTLRSRLNQVESQLSLRVQQLELEQSRRLNVSRVNSIPVQAPAQPDPEQPELAQDRHRAPIASRRPLSGFSVPVGINPLSLGRSSNTVSQSHLRVGVPVPTPRSSHNRTSSTIANSPSLQDPSCDPESPIRSSSTSSESTYSSSRSSDHICQSRPSTNFPNHSSLPENPIHSRMPDTHRSCASIQSSRITRLSNRINDCAHSISLITAKDLSNLSRAQVMEYCKYDFVSLQELRKEMLELEKKLDNEHQVDDEVFDRIETSLSLCKRFENDLNTLRKQHYLHLESDKSMLKKLELEVFDGSPDKDTVYNFLSLFSRLTDGVYSPSDQAAILFTTYLSEPIRRECESFKHDIVAMKEWLILQHGDLREVVDSKLKSIAKLKHPGTTTASQIDYYKHIMQLLLHVESLSHNDFVDTSEITSIIHNVTLVKSIVASLPDSVVTRFSKLIQNEPKIPPPSGHKYFSILKGMLDKIWRELHTENSIKSIRQSSVEHVSKPPKSVNIAEASSETPAPRWKSKQKKANGSPTALAFPCTFHPKRSKPDHELGNCRTFFSSSNRQRQELAKTLKICFTCFKPDCLKRSPQVCVSNLPPGLICPDCAQISSRRTPNVLICCDSSHQKPPLSSIETNLLIYFKVLDKKLVGQLKPTFSIVTATTLNCDPLNPVKPKSLSSPVVPSMPVPKFDTQCGSPLSHSSIVLDSAEDSVYIFQHIKIKDKTGLLFYDSGATGHCVRGKFAEEAGFKVVNSETQQVGSFGNQSLWTDYGIYKCV